MAEFVKNTKGNMIFYTAPQLSGCRKIRHAYFTRTGGVSEGVFKSLNMRFHCGDEYENVVRNHVTAGLVIGARPEDIVCTRQKHTDNIRVIKGQYTEEKDREAGVDALVTDVPGLCLTAYHADCQVVMLFDHKKEIAAIVHAGWRGVQNGIVGKTLETMHDVWGSSASDVIAAVGPSICRGCFETDEDVPELMKQAYGGFAAEYIYKEGDKWHIDLKNMTYSTLLQHGVSSINIDISNICPCCSHEHELWWSQRRHGDNRGVQGAMIMIK